MELYVRVFLHRHLQGVGRLSQEDVPTLFVLGQIQGLAHLEVGKLFLIVTRYPSGLVKRDRLVTAGSIVFVQEAILDDLKLQLTHRADDLSSRHLTREELRHTLVSQLFQTLGQLFRLHRVGVLHITELLGREAWDALVVEDFTLSQYL